MPDFSRFKKSISGRNPDGEFQDIRVDDQGNLIIKNQVVDLETLEWVPQQQGSSSGITQEVEVQNFPAMQAATGPLTDEELRATQIPVSGPLTDAELRDAPVPVTLGDEPLVVTGPFYPETQPIDAVSLPLPSGASTETKQDAIIEEISNKDIMLALKVLTQVLANPAYVDKLANQLRAQVTGTVAATGTLTGVTTVTGLTNLNAYAANLLIIDQNRAAWANVARSRIS